jgi:hypothetical protein
MDKLLGSSYSYSARRAVLVLVLDPGRPFEYHFNEYEHEYEHEHESGVRSTMINEGNGKGIAPEL